MFISATLPASHSALVPFESWVRKSGFMYSVSAFIVSSAITASSVSRFGSAVPASNSSPP